MVFSISLFLCEHDAPFQKFRDCREYREKKMMCDLPFAREYGDEQAIPAPVTSRPEQLLAEKWRQKKIDFSAPNICLLSWASLIPRARRFTLPQAVNSSCQGCFL